MSLHLARLVAAVLVLPLGAEARLKGGQPEAAGERPSPPALCDEALVRETCSMLGDDGTSAMPGDVAELLAATPEAVAVLWAAEALPVGEAVQCDALCRGTTALLKQLGRRVPPASDTGCYDQGGGNITCDLDLSPGAIASLAAASSGDFEFTKGLTAMGVPAEGNESSKEMSAVEPAVFEYSTADLAARVAQLFRIYPALSEGGLVVDELPSAKASAAVSRALLERRLQESTTYVNLAIRTFPRHGTRTELRLFFGEAATTDRTSRRKILGVLNSIRNVLGYASFDSQGSRCGRSTFGYVFPCRRSPMERDASGRFRIFLCSMFWSTQNEQICTLVHEASHHSTACTKDIRYGARQCKALALSNPRYALINADNYGYYIREVAQNRGTF